MNEPLMNEKYLESVKAFKPTAVIAPRGKDERYGWGTPEMDARANEPIWEPALAGEWSCMPLGQGLLMTKALAEQAAREVAASLKIALKNA